MDGTVSGWITAKLYILVKKKKKSTASVKKKKKNLNRNEAKQSAVY